jgi:hypothetical protein
MEKKPRSRRGRGVLAATGWVLSLVAGLAALAAAGVATAADGRGGRADDLRGRPLAETWADTLHVGAPRVTLDEIIADIGRQQRANRDSLRSVAFTAVITTARTPQGQAPAGTDSLGTWEVDELALRYEQRHGLPDRVVRLWQRERKFEHGVPQPPKDKPAARPEWQPRSNDMVQDLPFAEGGAARYRYELLRSTMVGNSLVHVVAFAPKDRFAALPSGTIWVDIADWAIRRVDVRFDGAVPLPWVIRAIPRYRLRQAPCGGVWFPVLETARIELRDLPLLDSGGAYDMRIELRDIVINGEPCECGAGAADEGDEVGAPVDGAAFWATIDTAWQADLPTALQAPPSLAPAQLDSLSQAGAAQLAGLPDLPPWRLRPRPVTPTFNRAQGFVPRAGLRLDRTGGPARLDAEVGRGFADHRVEWGVQLRVQPQARLELLAGGARATGVFAGDGRPGQRAWSALLWGADPNHYFDRDRWNASLTWTPRDALWLRAEGARVRELPLGMRTDWNVLGRKLAPAAMRAADALDADVLALGAGARVGALSLVGGLERAWVTPRVPAGADEETPGSTTVDAWRWAARLREQDGLGNTWTLAGGGRGVSAGAPVQWRVWLGDQQPASDTSDLTRAGSLCGWPAGTLLGDRGLWASLKVDINADPWRALKVPGLRALQLQPEVFAEWAGAWGSAGSAGAGFVGAVDPGLVGTPPTGWRADVGLGFSRRVDLPLAGLGSRVVVRGARAVGAEAGEQGWRVLVGVGK